MCRRSLSFWAWPVAAATGTSVAIGLDIAGIALGYLPPVPGLLITFALPAVAGFALGLGNRSARWTDLTLMAGIVAAWLYCAFVAVSALGILLSSNVSCAEPNAPWNCDNDTGAAVGIVLGAPLAVIYGIGAWIGSVAGAPIARKTAAALASRSR